MKLQVNDPAPNFSAIDQNNQSHKLTDYQGKWLLLYFYPKDNTPGCVKEACNFRDNFAELNKYLTILGVSGDSVKNHQSMQQKYHLNFPLLADPEKIIIRAYGTDGLIFTKRTSFLINPNGIIEKIYERVNPEVHAKQIIQDIINIKKS